MRLLQQDEQHVNMLWRNYLAKKNEIYQEAKIAWAQDCNIESGDERLATELYDEVLVHRTYIEKKEMLDADILSGAFKESSYKTVKVKSDKRRLSIPVVAFTSDQLGVGAHDSPLGDPTAGGVEMMATNGHGNGPSTPDRGEGIREDERGSWVEGSPLEALSR